MCIILEEMSATFWGTDQYPVAKCVVFVRDDVMLFFDLYRVFKSMKWLSFDSPTETDVVRYPTSEKGFVPVPAGNQS